MTAVTYVVTRDAETGHFHVIFGPTARELDTMALFEGSVLLVAIDEQRRTARLLRVLRGDPRDFLLWCRRSGYRPIELPDTVPSAAALAARPIISL